MMNLYILNVLPQHVEEIHSVVTQRTSADNMTSEDIERLPDSASKTRRRALLIGIDYYDQFDRCKNLHGCISDINGIQDVLSSNQLVPEDSILVLRGDIPQGRYPQPQAPISPGRDEIIDALRTITSQSSPGDFVYFHFSGHGTHQETVYPEKRGTRKDEAICCADGSIIRDVELGVLLDGMAAKGLKVLAVLDCCHSGGATRISSEEGWTVRERAPEPISKDIEWLGQDTIIGEDSKVGPSAKTDHWFWKDRAYHLIAACQPYEFAREFIDDDDRTHGLLTFYLIESLRNLEPILFATPYHTLIQLLRAKCQSKNMTRSQCPVLYGESNKIIFNLTESSKNPAAQIKSTLVLRVEGQHAILGRGFVDGVCLGDVYQLSKFADGDESFEVQVTQVSEFEARAKPRDCKLQSCHEFWVARLIKAADEAHVVFDPVDCPSDAIDCVRAEWEYHMDPEFPLELSFDEQPDKADFYVRLTESEFRILSAKREPFPNVPRLIAEGQPGMTRKLSANIIHLNRYLKFDTLRPEEGDEYEGNWEFQVTKKPTGKDKNAIARYRISFHNNSPRTRVFISIFNLAPDWSIEQIVPNHGSPGEPVEPNTSIDPFSVLVNVPDLLKETKPKSMVDKLKILITTEAHDFSHWQIPSIAQAQSEPYRNVRECVQGKFTVGEKILTHALNTSEDSIDH